MRVSRQTQSEHRTAILEQAGKLFRRYGIDAVGVADITRAAGLTHGAFYGHYDLKAALAAASCLASLRGAAVSWRRRAERMRAAGDDPVAAIIAAYLSPGHRDRPEDGCVLAALGPEVARAEAPLADALASGTAALVEVLAEELARRHPQASAADIRGAATAVLAAMTGGLILARVFAADPARSQAALDSAAELARRAAAP